MVMVHYHIFKNGGSTIDYVLDREFGVNFRTLHGPDPTSIMTGSDLRKFLTDHPGLQAVSSHHLRYPTWRDQNSPVIDACMLRHPLDRLSSVYRYLRNRHLVSNDPLCEAARQLSIQSFFAFCLDRYSSWVQNVQVAWLTFSGGHEGNLSYALAELKEINLLGTLDQFDESLSTWEYALAPIFPGISLHYLTQNMTGSPQATLATRLEMLRQICGPGLFNELSAANSSDLELFEVGSSIVQERFRRRPDSDCWLVEFQERNRRLEFTCRTSFRARIRNRIFHNSRKRRIPHAVSEL
jgi:hypothetical protein